MPICKKVPGVGIQLCHFYVLLISVDASDLNILQGNKTITNGMINFEPSNRWKMRISTKSKHIGHRCTRVSVSKSSSSRPWSSSHRLYTIIRVPWSFIWLNYKEKGKVRIYVANTQTRASQVRTIIEQDGEHQQMQHTNSDAISRGLTPTVVRRRFCQNVFEILPCPQ